MSLDVCDVQQEYSRLVFLVCLFFSMSALVSGKLNPCYYKNNTHHIHTSLIYHYLHVKYR